MNSTASAPSPNASSSSALAEENALLREQVQTLQRQLDWFKKQLFGPKSEKQAFDLPGQNSLFQEGDAPVPENPPEEKKRTVKAYQRGTGKKQRDDDCLNDTGLRFTADVPVEVIEHLPPELTGPEADQYEVIGSKTTYRLAQRASSYVVLKCERPVFRRKGTEKLITTPAPFNVLDNSLADVSLLAGLLVDKFQFHLPLYRQHQRIQQAGITVSRSTLTNLVKRAIDLLRPIVDAQTDNVLRSRVLAMDETPIKAGHQGRAGPQKGKMKSGWFWPLYGDADEVVFTYSNSRGRAHIEEVLSESFSGTLISDGYAAYARYAAAQENVTHAQCWVHSRRYFIEAQKDHPEIVTDALQQIATVYRNEEAIKTQGLTGEKKRQYRLDHSKPVVSDFFQWCRDQLAQGGLVPSDSLTKALNYVLSREASLTVFLEDPDVQPDTNHLERALRPIPMGKKNWMFCWTELGAEHLGVIQSLISTCKLHDITPYTYLVDVLQRISQHPAREVSDLTPRLWKPRFADNPLRALIDPRHPDRQNKQPEANVRAH
ncbi:IS66 family transposase (plasmid) [Marinobacter nanhaiticus D15-8W]|uniref:IS66 family transposase n=1 Tax=Marinobacter nanhaiticus TaxID=1305740 RepID=UPI0002CBB661|nr:IS66 family transposase [Marinobacter nanhaiticus]KXS53725.1 MAG: ISPpu14, transposase Orf3 [Marinobacter sp. T13-3]BES70225.1 IS66 family transposase [Marinobacter nanhaiticus D15-8W]BES70870.1 IS66 family transposase [Marinobacter nanhaiticus D15-8W]BES72055.1 IS66 family transposase [Marinobacter nanhaiticus D15-8W]BES73046.1 IS66 family transposase [Marinobacter nanhaiticus D15-8W]